MDFYTCVKPVGEPEKAPYHSGSSIFSFPNSFGIDHLEKLGLDFVQEKTELLDKSSLDVPSSTNTGLKGSSA